MIANAIIGMTALATGMTGASAVVQTTAQAPPVFSESLLAASKTLSKPDTANEDTPKGTSRQRFTFDDARTPGSHLAGHATFPQSHYPLASVPLQVILPKPAPIANPTPITVQNLFTVPVSSPDASAIVADQPTHDVAAERVAWAKSDVAQTGTLQPGSYSAQTSSIGSGVANLAANAPAGDVAKPGNEVSNAVAKAASSPVREPVQDFATSAVPDGLPASMSGIVSKAASNSSPIAGPVPSLSVAANASPEGVERSGLTNPAESAPVVPASKSDDEFSDALVKAVLDALQSPNQDAKTNANPDRAQSSTPGVAPSAASISTRSSDTAPTLHTSLNALPNGAVAAVPSTGATDIVLPPAPTPSENVFTGSALIASGIAADQLGAFTQPGNGLLVMGQAGVSRLNSNHAMQQSAGSAVIGKDESKTEIKDASGLNQHAQPAPDQAGSKTGSQEASIPGDQSQSGTSSQWQGVAQPQMNNADHSAAGIAHVHNSANGSVVQIAPTIVAGTSLAAKGAGDAAPISTAIPQTLPVINTARLIQAMGQSEIRVGMRTSEFGNISISTSVARDVISGQISVDHGELAKIIAAGLPEMQARLGGNQAVDFKIEMNGAGTAHDAGTSSGMPNGSADQSRGGRQQTGNSASGYSTNGVAERHSSIAAVATTTGGDRLNARLDIRV